MRVFLVLLGLLLILIGGAIAAAQYAPPSLLALLDSAPQAKEFLATQAALYAGAGAAGLGLLLIIIAAATGGKKKADKARASAKTTDAPKIKEARTIAPSMPAEAAPKPVAPVRPESKPSARAAPVSPAPSPRPALAPAPAAASPHAAAAVSEAPKPKPQASAQPPASAQTPAMSLSSKVEALRSDPRLYNRRRVQDLVTINDALKAYHKTHGAYPAAAGLGGILDRGEAWIPGLAPDILPELPRDPAMSMERDGPQYVYTSDGKDYKLLVQNVSLVGSTNVAVLGVKIDMTRKPTQENAAFGFWTEGFASA